METPPLGRIGFWLILPALLLPPVPAVLVTEAARNWEPPDGFYEVGATVFIGVPLFFIYVLLASMTTNAWLLLSNGWVRAHRSVGRGVAICLISEVVLLALWSFGLAFEVSGEPEGPNWVRALPVITVGLMAGGLAAFVFALRLRPYRNYPKPPLPALPFLVAYSALTAIAFTLVGLGGTKVSDTLIGDTLHWFLAVVGLPWSLGALLFAPGAMIASTRTGVDDGILIRIFLLVPLVVNVILLLRLYLRAALRSRHDR